MVCSFVHSLALQTHCVRVTTTDLRPSWLQRGDVSCGLLQNALWLGGVPGSAHCLVWDQKMYNGYYIGQSTLDFTVHVNVKTDGSAPTPTPGPQASSSSSPGPAAGSATPASPNASPGATLPPPMTPASTAAVRRRMLLGGTSTTTASATPAAGSTPAAGPSSTPGNPANATTLLWDLRWGLGGGLRSLGLSAPALSTPPASSLSHTA